MIERSRRRAREFGGRPDGRLIEGVEWAAMHTKKRMVILFSPSSNGSDNLLRSRE